MGGAGLARIGSDDMDNKFTSVGSAEEIIVLSTDHPVSTTKFPICSKPQLQN